MDGAEQAFTGGAGMSAPAVGQEAESGLKTARLDAETELSSSMQRHNSSCRGNQAYIG